MTAYDVFGGVPEDLVILEIERRELAAYVRTTPGACEYRLYRTRRAIAAHPWLTERAGDRRAARASLRAATDGYLAERPERTRLYDVEVDFTDGRHVSLTGISWGRAYALDYLQHTDPDLARVVIINA